MPHGSGIATCFTPVLTSRRPSNHQGPAQRRLRDDARRGDVTMGIDRYGAQLRGVIVLVVESVTDNQPQLTKLDSKENDRRSRDVRLEKPKVWALLIGQWSIYSLGNS